MKAYWVKGKAGNITNSSTVEIRNLVSPIEIVKRIEIAVRNHASNYTDETPEIITICKL